MQFLFHMQFRTRFLMSGSRRKPLSRHRNRARASMVVCHGLPLMSSVAIVSASSPSVIYTSDDVFSSGHHVPQLTGMSALFAVSNRSRNSWMVSSSPSMGSNRMPSFSAMAVSNMKAT